MTGQGEQTWWLLVGMVAGRTGVTRTLGLTMQQMSRGARQSNRRVSSDPDTARTCMGGQREHTWWLLVGEGAGCCRVVAQRVQGARLSSPRPAAVHPS
jgi:hypothetical protein